MLSEALSVFPNGRTHFFSCKHDRIWYNGVELGGVCVDKRTALQQYFGFSSFRDGQQALIDAGYKSYVRSADGIYGQWTYDAVRAYQKDVGLSVDGIAGKNTQNKLYGTKY